jgi:hypothetical protein
MSERHKISACDIFFFGLLLGPLYAILATPAAAQTIDKNQAPNAADAGISKTYVQEIGAGRGDLYTLDSSMFIIKRDPFRAIRRGRQLFQRKFTKAQGVGSLTGDGAGDISADQSIGAGLSDSCALCHGLPRGAAGHGGQIAIRPDSRNAPHLFGLGLLEMLGDEITFDLRTIAQNARRAAAASGRNQTERLVSKGIDYGAVTARPNGMVDTSNVQGVNRDLRVRPFFAEGKTISIREFIVGALNAEMGLKTYDPDLAAASRGARVVTPAGMVLDGRRDQIEGSPARSRFEDSDRDGVRHEVPEAIIDHMEFYLLNYFKPGTGEQTAPVMHGRQTFETIGCARCHIPDLQINRDRRVADVETTFDPLNGVFNRLYATATPLYEETNDRGRYPSLKRPKLGPFLVKNIFADLKRHDLGPNFHERMYDGTVQKLFMTEPLWGVGSTAPYGHDGRSINLREVILRHGGEAQTERDAFDSLSEANKEDVIAFLNSLILFPPDDTTSNLEPANRSDARFPQWGHGSIKLSVLFNDPNDSE